MSINPLTRVPLGPVNCEKLHRTSQQTFVDNCGNKKGKHFIRRLFRFVGTLARFLRPHNHTIYPSTYLYESIQKIFDL